MESFQPCPDNLKYLLTDSILRDFDLAVLGCCLGNGIFKLSWNFSDVQQGLTIVGYKKIFVFKDHVNCTALGTGPLDHCNHWKSNYIFLYLYKSHKSNSPPPHLHPPLWKQYWFCFAYKKKIIWNALYHLADWNQKGGSGCHRSSEFFLNQCFRLFLPLFFHSSLKWLSAESILGIWVQVNS